MGRILQVGESVLPVAQVVYAHLPANLILNLRSPRYLTDVRWDWHADKQWWNPRYEPLRDLMERTYVQQFNSVCGYFELLEKSILEEGFRNPVVVTAGRMQVRQFEELPFDWRGRITKGFFLEYEGGARLLIAQRLGIKIPCIINDFHGLVPSISPLVSTQDVRQRFLDAPGMLRFNPDGSVYLGKIPHAHLPVEKRSGIPVVRQFVVEKVKRAVRDWLRTHDYRY